jgi:hypothetical protein
MKFKNDTDISYFFAYHGCLNPASKKQGNLFSGQNEKVGDEGSRLAAYS